MSREIPYSPMEKRKYVGMERMREILGKHMARIEASRGSVSQPITNGSSLFWKRVSDDVIESKCGRCRIYRKGEGNYMCLESEGDEWVHFGTGEDAHVARLMCQGKCAGKPTS